MVRQLEGQSVAQMNRVCVVLSVLLAAVIATAAPAPAQADRIRLTNGRTLEGAVRDLGESVEITLAFGGKITLARSSIVAIERTSDVRQDYLRRAAAASGTDPDAQVELALWCRQRGMDEETREHLRRALLLDPEHPRALRELGYLAPAGSWPERPPTWESTTTSQLVIHSALPRHEARILADELELLTEGFAATYRETFELKPLREPVQVRVYLDATQFGAAAKQEFHADVSMSTLARAHLDGFADPKRSLIVARVQPGVGARGRETIFHELTHVLMTRMLEEGKRISAPSREELERIREIEMARLVSGKGLMWYHEGLASYYGGSSIREGRFEAGSYLSGGQSEVTLKRLQQAILAREALPLDNIVDAGAAEFLGDHYDLFYSQSWMFVHFLQHAQNGKYRARWLKVVADLRRNDGGVEYFKRVFGFAPSHLQEEWQQYALERGVGK